MVLVPSTDSTFDYLLDKVLGSVILHFAMMMHYWFPDRGSYLKPTIS